MSRLLRKLLGALALTGLLLVLLAALAPATWLDLALQRASRGVLGLGAAEGTVWRGGGTLQAVLPNGSAVTLSPVRWRLYAGELLHGRLRVDVRSARTGEVLLDASIAPAGVALHEARLEAPAAVLGGLSPTLREADPGGILIVRASGFGYAAGRFSGQAEVEWRDAASSLTTVNPLGSYHVSLTGGAGGLSCQLDSLDEPALVLTGRTVWQPGRPFTFDGTARPAEAHRQELAPLLRILGREVSPGTYSLRVSANVGAL